MEGHVHELNKLLQLIRWQKANESNDELIAQEWQREARLGDNVEAMAWGKSLEDESVKQYEITRNVRVIRPGFVVHPDYPDLVGDSSDFIECHNGKVNGTPMYAGEIKCPHKEIEGTGYSKYHVQYLQYGMPKWYHHQVQGHIEVQGAIHPTIEQGKFVSYDPRHPVERDRIYVQRVERDPAWSEKFHERMTEFSRHFKRGSQFEHQISGVRDGIPSMF